jgi:hypothetical protein
MDNFNGTQVFAAIAAKFDYIPRRTPRLVSHISAYDMDRLIDGLLFALGEIENVEFTKPRSNLIARLTAAEYIAQTVALTIEDYNENYERPAPAALMRGLQDLAATLTEDAVRDASAALEERVTTKAAHVFGDIDDLMLDRLEFPRDFLPDLIREGAMIISKEIKKEAAFAA